MASADLLAIAFVRRALLELGAELDAERLAAMPDVGPLELWVRRPRAEFGGKTPAELLSESDGPLRLFAYLEKAVKPVDGEPFQGSLWGDLDEA